MARPVETAAPAPADCATVDPKLGKVRPLRERAVWSDAEASLEASGPLQDAWWAATRHLERCVVAHAGRPPILHEGGIYDGAWVESTASLCCEVLARFSPKLATETMRRVLSQPAPSGQLPYKVTPHGPSYRQIQMVTPFARSVLRVAALSGDADLLADAYPALAGHDAWLATHRDTRGTGGVEAFCTYDTGHDRSPRFWHIPDGCPGGDAARYDRDNPRLPFVAPDLTANVAAQRLALAEIAAALGEDPEPWRAAAARSLDALMAHTWHAEDGTFYDLDARGEPVRVNTDALLRVLACGVGDDAFFDQAVRAHLLNTRRFFAAYPFTSVAMDDARFDPHVQHNSWAGPTNMLAILRAPDAFEAHGRYVELAWALWPTVAALSREIRFAQTISPWRGDQGFTSDYAPAILALLDFVERCCGVLPRPDGSVWVTGASVPQVQHDVPATTTHYRRRVGERRLGLRVAEGTATLEVDGRIRATFPAGLRLVLDADLNLVEIVGLVGRTVTGPLTWGDAVAEVAIAGNERWSWNAGHPTRTAARGIIAPR